MLKKYNQLDVVIDSTSILRLKYDEILTEFYTEACDEEDRLRSSKRGNLEFITTTTYIDKYLCPGDRILEIGAGPGIYSNYFGIFIFNLSINIII